ncbi:hypothetical protein NUSPORA_00905 [Nucleospora cyclopteri]
MFIIIFLKNLISLNPSKNRMFINEHTEKFSKFVSKNSYYLKGLHYVIKSFFYVAIFLVIYLNLY